MKHVVQNEPTAEQTLEYYNHFHDSFIKYVQLLSHDEFLRRGEQSSNGRLDLEILFAHYNYRNGEVHHTQTVESKFFQVMDIQSNFSGLIYEWSIDFLEIEETTRIIEGQQTETCMKAVMTQKRLNEQNQWEGYVSLQFTFHNAVFQETENEQKRYGS